MVKPEEAAQIYARRLNDATDTSTKTVMLLAVQMCCAASQNRLMRCDPSDSTKFGADWDDPIKFAPPEVGPTRY